MKLNTAFCLFVCSMALCSPKSFAKQGKGFPYPDREQIKQVLQYIPDSNYAPAPPITDRGFWKAFSSPKIIDRAVVLAGNPVPVITDEDYLNFSKTGQRTRFTALRRERRDGLKTLVLAECLENKGRFLEKIEEYIESYCVMRSWTDSAHDKKLKIFRGKTIGVDLFAAENAIILSATYSLLEPRLSDETKKRLKYEIRRRITDPYLAACRKRSLEGTYSFWWLTGDNNWNAVCTAGILYSTLIMSESKEERAEAIACGLNGLKFYLAGFTADGYCSEGMHYWEYGFGNYLLLGDVLRSYTGGKINLFDSSKVRKIAEFPVELELVNNRYPAYADSKISDKPSPYSRFALARNFGIPYYGKKSDLFAGYFQQILMNITLGTGGRVADAPTPALRSWFDIAHVLVCRPANTEHSFYASIKAGNNGENHNHDDVGSYVVLRDGMFACIDPGPEYYTARTFSKDRYVSKLINSYGHPVPLVAGKLQSTGKQFAGRVLSKNFSPEKDTLQLDLATAYKVPALQKLHRNFEFDRAGQTVCVTDSVVFSQPENFGTAIITYEDFKIVSSSEIHMGDVKVSVSATGGALVITPKVIDENAVAGSKPTRIGIDFAEPVQSGSITVSYEAL